MVWDNSTGQPKAILFYQNSTGDIYLNLLQESVVPRDKDLFGDKEISIHIDRVFPHYHRDVKTFIKATFANG